MTDNQIPLVLTQEERDAVLAMRATKADNKAFNEGLETAAQLAIDWANEAGNSSCSINYRAIASAIRSRRRP